MDKVSYRQDMRLSNSTYRRLWIAEKKSDLKSEIEASASIYEIFFAYLNGIYNIDTINT